MHINLIVLTGPTGVGKTNLSLEIARKLNAEIISGDSVQVYQKLNIGSAKILPSDMKDIPHHLIDFLPIENEYNAAQFKVDAEICINKILNKNKLPILVGGSGLYINGLIYDYQFSKIPKNEHYRQLLIEIVRQNGICKLYEKLVLIDENSAKKISPTDEQRIIRALEVFHVTGVPFSKFNNNIYDNAKYNMLYFALTMERSNLYNRINIRVDQMIEAGLINEVQQLLDQGYSRKNKALQTIGYKEIVEYLYGEITLSKAIDKIKQNSRHYAKRQLTWFRKDPNIIWLNKDKLSDSEIYDQILSRYYST